MAGDLVDREAGGFQKAKGAGHVLPDAPAAGAHADLVAEAAGTYGRRCAGSGGTEAGRGAGPQAGLEPMFVVADHAGMRAVAEPVEKGQSRVLLDAAFPLAEAAEAHARGETDRATGKTRLHGPLGSCRDSPRARGP